MINPKIIEAAVLNKNISIDSICKYIESVSTLNIKGICFPSSFVNIVQLRECIEEHSYRNSFDVIGVVGYPNGDTSMSSKLAEVSDLCGFSTIIDVVLNPVYIQSGMWNFVRGEMIEIFLSTNAEVRWIIETPILTNEQIISVTNLILETGGNIKTASGTKGGTKVEHVALIHSLVSPSGKNTFIKAAGGINTPQDAAALVIAGAKILGCSTPSKLL